MAFHRRELIHGLVATGTASIAAATESNEPVAESESIRAMPPTVIDTNVSLFPWPFRRLPLDDIDKLCAKFSQLGISEAWAGSFEGLLHRDMRQVNARLVKACENRPQLTPIGAINPNLADWRHDLKLCLGRLGMPGVRLFPSYHGYSLDNVAFGELLGTATELGGFVQVVVTIEDTRTQPDAIQAPDVDPRPLSHWMRKLPQAKVQLLNCRPSASDRKDLASIPRVTVDTSRVDGTDGIGTLAEAIGVERILYGSHSPFLIPEAACIRMLENDMPLADVKAIMHANAQHFLGTKSTLPDSQQR